MKKSLVVSHSSFVKSKICHPEFFMSSWAQPRYLQRCRHRV